MSKVMPEIKGEKIDGREVPKYYWNTDLIYFDGPLLSLFKGVEDSDALFLWLDCDDKRNRWCIIPVDREALWSFLKKEKSLFEVFNDCSDFIIFNSGKKGRRTGYTLTSKDCFPKDYAPDPESFLTDDISTEAAKNLVREKKVDYELGLDGNLYIDDLSAIPKLYQQLYSFHYGLSHIDRLAIQNTVSGLIKDWSGGLSAVNIFTGLRNVIPSIHRVRLKEVRYASPGMIKFNLLNGVALEIQSVIGSILDRRRFSDLEHMYKDIYKFFRRKGISGFEDERSGKRHVLTDDVEAELNFYVTRFFSLMGWERHREAFFALEANSLQQMRLLLAYYRRARALRSFIVAGKLKLPN